MTGRGEPLQVGHRGSAPRHVLGVPCRLRPQALDAQPEGGLASRERHRVLGHAADRAPQRPERDLAVGRGGRDLLDAGVHQVSRHLGEVGALHVEAFAPGHRVVVHLLDREVALRADGVLDGIEVPQRPQLAFGQLQRAAVERAREHDRPPARALPGALEVHRREDLVGPGRPELGEPRRQLSRPVDVVADGPGRHDRPDGVQPELERRHHPEVRPGAAESPEEIGVFVLAGAHDPTVRRHDLGGDQVVDGQPVPAHEPAHAAAQGEAADPRVADHADRTGQPKGLGLPVELGEQRATCRPGGPRVGIDPHPSHPREVDHDPPVACREPRHAVPAPPDGHDQVLLAGEPEGRDHVGRPGAAGDDRRMTVGDPVPDDAGPVVVPVAAHHHRAREAGPEGVQGDGVRRPRRRRPRAEGPAMSASDRHQSARV